MVEWVGLIVVVGLVAVRTMFAGIVGWAIDQFSGGIDSAFGWVRDFVHRVVGTVEDFLLGVIDDVRSSLSAVVTWVWDETNALIDDLRNALGWWVNALGAIVRAVDDFAHWVEQEALDGIRWIGGVLWDGIRALGAEVWKGIDDLASWVNDHVLGPLTDAVRNIVDYIGNTLVHWINEAFSNVWCFVKDVASGVGNVATSVFNTLLSPFSTVLSVALKAIEWLTWMALHPLDWFDTLIHDFLARSGTYLFDLIAKAVSENFAKADAWLAKFFE